jgi:hypothetical protein
MRDPLLKTPYQMGNILCFLDTFARKAAFNCSFVRWFRGCHGAQLTSIQMTSIYGPIEFIAVASIVVLIAAIHVFGFGSLLVRLANVPCKDFCSRGAIVGGAGFAALGFEMWALGYVGGWSSQALAVSTLLILLFCIALFRNLKDTLNETFVGLTGRLNSLDKLQLTLASLAAITFLAAVISGLRPPLLYDEIDYHWPAPLYWANNHHWLPSPYRLTNGPVLVELLYTIAAVFSSSTGGHWLATMLWLVLLLACAGLGRLIAVPAFVVIVAVMACPVITTVASMMGNDLGASVFVVTAFLTMLQMRESKQPYRIGLLSSFILCAGISSKAPYAVAAAPAMLAYSICFCDASRSVVRRLALALTLGIPCLLVGGLWCLHTFGLTHHFLDVPMQAISTSRPITTEVQSLHNPTGMVTLPNLSTAITLPLLPFITSIFGNQEPFGGRTGLIICPWLPFLLWQLKKLKEPTKHYAWWMVAASMLYYIEIGLLTPRTRYFIFTWAIWSTLAAAGFWLTYQSVSSGKRKFVAVAFCGLAAISCIDGIRTNLLYRPEGFKSIMMQLEWFQK